MEDDVRLCVWVRKECDEELTVRQAGKLRTAMQAVIARTTKVVIFVEGGVVQGCTSNNKNLIVIVVDRDNIEAEEDQEQAERDATAGTEDCVHEVF